MKNDLSTEEQLKKYKKRFYVTLIVLGLFVAASGYYVYLNYDYLAFKHFITQHYIYTDTLDQLCEETLKRDVNNKYYKYFDDIVIATVTAQIRSINNDRYTYLYIPEQYQQYKREEKEEAEKSEIKALNENTVYMHLTNFSKHTEKFVKDNSEELQQYSSIIIDLRNNYGGDIFAMNNIADLFLPKGNILATDFMRIMNWTHKTKKKQALSYENIIILQNRNSASASENFIAALNDNLPHVTLIGETTFGKGIGQFTLPLKRGFAVKATTMRWYTPNGKNIHQQGISPEIPYTEEDMIDFALKQLSQQ